MTSVSAARHSRRSPRSWRGAGQASGRFTPLVWVAAGAFGVVAAGQGTTARAAVGVLGMAVFVIVAMSGRKLALTFVMSWLVLLGFIRRALIPFAGWSDHDPLLLVSPMAAVILLVIWSRREAGPRRNAMSTVVLLLLMVCVAEAVNPNEHQLIVATQSLLFYFTPLMWFFVGARLTEAEHRRVLDVLFWMTLPVVALGLYQSFVGLLPFELHWLGVSHQSAALYIVPFKFRPFSTLTSPQEYGGFLALSLVLTIARLYHRPRHPLLLWGLLSLTFMALVLESSRAVFIFFVVAVAVMTVVRLRSLTAVLMTIAALATVGLLTIHTGPTPVKATQKHASLAAALFSHEIEGLAHPDQGTGPAHVSLIVSGMNQSVQHPLGLGISHGTIAGARAATDQASQDAAAGAENDVANTFAAAGILGGTLLIILIALGLTGATRLYRARPSVIHLAWLGFGVAALTQWLSGAAYATSTFLFISLGGIAKQLVDLRTALPPLPGPSLLTSNRAGDRALVTTLLPVGR